MRDKLLTALECVEHRTGIEPANTGFADQRVSHFATGALFLACLNAGQEAILNQLAAGSFQARRLSSRLQSAPEVCREQ